MADHRIMIQFSSAIWEFETGTEIYIIMHSHATVITIGNRREVSSYNALHQRLKHWRKNFLKEKTRISTTDTRKRLIETKPNDQIDFAILNWKYRNWKMEIFSNLKLDENQLFSVRFSLMINQNFVMLSKMKSEWLTLTFSDLKYFLLDWDNQWDIFRD